MTAYTKYSLVPTEEPKEGKMSTAFDYSSVFSYSSAFDYNTTTASGHYKSAFDYGYGSTEAYSNNDKEKEERSVGRSIMNCISTVLIVTSYIFICITFPITLWFCIKKLQQWERLIVFRLGHLKGSLGPGMVFIIPWLDRYTRVDMRTKAFSVPPQQLITIDNGIIEMGCEVKYRVSDVERLTISVTSPEHGLRSYGKTVLLNVLTKKTVRDMEKDRLLIAAEMLKELNARVLNWGVEIGQVDLSTVNVLKEAEPNNPLKPILSALGNPGSGSATVMDAFGSALVNTDTYSNASAKSSLLDFGTLAKMSGGLGGFQGITASQPDNKKGKTEPPAGTKPTPKTKLGRYLQTMIGGPGGADLSNGVYRLQVEGKDGGIFCIFVATGIRQVVEGDLPRLAPDVSVVISREDLTAILEGTLAPLQAYLSGRLTVQGNFQLLMGFESLRQTNPPSDGIFVA